MPDVRLAMQKIDSLRAESKLNLEAGREYQQEWQVLYLWWLDKVITLSVTIVGVSITILTALRDKFPPPESFFMGNFVILWTLFAWSTIFALISHIAFSHLKQIQSGLYIFESRKNEQESMVVYPDLMWQTDGQRLSQENIEQINGNILALEEKIKTFSQKEDFWIFLTKFGYASLIFFLVGISWFIVLGYDFIY